MMGRNWPEATVATARRLAREGESVRTIAARLGVPRGTVGDWTRGIDALRHFTCDHCGDRFTFERTSSSTPSRGRFVFCSPEHRNAFHVDRRRHERHQSAVTDRIRADLDGG